MILDSSGGNGVNRWLLFFGAITVFLVSGCTGTVNTFVAPNTDLKKYKTAYVDLLQQDEFNLGAAIMAHVADMGFTVKTIPLPPEILSTYMVVKYDYYDGWDMRKYLKNFSIRFLDAKEGTLLLSSRYDLTGIWRGEEFRINYTFNDIRLKSGFPPLKDFAEIFTDQNKKEMEPVFGAAY